MALKAENISNGKPIGIGPVTILPGESKIIPDGYETNPMLDYYKEKGFLRVTGTVDSSEPKKRGTRKKQPAPPMDAGQALLELTKAKIASLADMSEEELGKLAEERGIKPADCKDVADMREKVRLSLLGVKE